MDLFLVGIADLYVEAAKLQLLAWLWHIAGLACDKTGDGRVIVILEIKVKEALDVVDLGRADNVIVAAFSLDDLYDLFAVDVLVFDLADDLLENVLDRDKAGDAAVFVDDDGDLDVI